MKGSNFTRSQTVPANKLSTLTTCIRLALGIAVTSAAFTSPVFAEGTKQWAPSSSHFAALGAMESNGGSTYPFAGYGQPEERRLHIHIDDPANEIVYVGLGKLTGGAGGDIDFNFYWRIVAPDGSVVHGSSLAGGAQANITSHAQAVAGPSALDPAGYSTSGNWTFDPAIAGKGAGDYYIEFDLNDNAASAGSYTEPGYVPNNAMNIKWFDITVATKGGSPRILDGRVWSKSWGVRTNDPAIFSLEAPFGTPFNGSMYAYDSNNFVTMIDFLGSGLRPLQGQFSFNTTGTGSSGNKAIDRKSVNDINSAPPQHKIFLNPPDTNIYPLGVDGSLQNLPLSINDTNNANIKVEATQPGSVEIVLDINKDGSYTAGIDRRLTDNVTAGVNSVPWDGKDGAGNKVAKSSYPIDVKIAYTQGETHFTAYDVEGLDNGFEVFTQTSSGLSGPNLLFWDDSNILDETQSTPDRGQVNVDAGNTLRRTWSNDSYGDLNTINTWWFAYRDYESSILNLTPSVELSVATASDTEAGGANLPVLVVSGNLLTDATVEIALSGTAVSGTDYNPATGPIVITIPKGNYADTQIPIPGLAITNESVVESDETLILTLQNPANIAIDDANANATTINQSTYTIINDDFNKAPVPAPDSGTTAEDTALNGTTVLVNDTDPDGDTLTINTTPVTAPTHGTVTLNSDGTYTYTPNKDYHGTDSFVYEAIDGNGGKATTTVTITITPVNDPPVITSTNNVTFPENGTGTALDVQSTDIDGDTETAGLTYTLLPAFDSSLFDIDPVTGKLTFKAPPDYEIPLDSNGDNAYILMTRVCDSTNLCTDQVEVIVVTNVVETNPPSIISTVTRTPENQTFVADVAATDPDASDTLTFSIAGGADAALFSIDPSSGELRFLTPHDFENPTDANKDNVYDVTVMVRDNTAPDHTDSQSLKVVLTNVNEAPSITSNGAGDTSNVAHDENATVVTTVTSADPDASDVITYTINGGADANLFTINPLTGELSFKTAPDFEHPMSSDGDNVYVVQVMADDSNSLFDLQTLNITVKDINDAPIITSDKGGDTADLHVDENTTAVTTATADDQDGDTPTYSITGGVDAALFSVDPNSGALTFVTAPDFESPADVAGGTSGAGNNVYEVQVTANDGKGGTDVQTLAITVDKVNESPVITSDGAGNTAMVSAVENAKAATTVVGEDQDGDTLSYAITGGVDQTTFSIDPVTGVLTFNEAPDFEKPTDLAGGTSAAADNRYEVEVTVSDGNGKTDVQILSVAVTNANDAPIITSDSGGDTATPSMAENTTAVTTVTSTDDDNDTPAYAITGGTDAGLFTINPTTGELVFKSAPDFENPSDSDVNNSYEVKVTVEDGKGGSDVQTLSVSVQDANDAPVISSNGSGNTAAMDIPENTTTITTVTSTDPDRDTPTYSISGGSDQDKFTIDPVTGVLSFTTAPDFENPTDSDGNRVYEVIVMTDDGKGGTDEQTLFITVLNVNDPPAITSNGAGETAALTVDENQVTTTTVIATDDDSDKLTYSLSGGVDVALFAINNVTGNWYLPKRLTLRSHWMWQAAHQRRATISTKWKSPLWMARGA